MENQPIEQQVEQSSQPQMEQTVPAQSSSSAPVIYIIAAIVAIAALAYFFMMPKTASEGTTDSQAVTEQAGANTVTSGNTTADISADLDNVTDASAGLNADAAAASGDLQSL